MMFSLSYLVPEDLLLKIVPKELEVDLVFEAEFSYEVFFQWTLVLAKA